MKKTEYKLYSETNQKMVSSVKNEKNQIQSENKNGKILVGSEKALILLNKNLQNEMLEEIISIGINKNQTILKKSVNHKAQGFEFKEKNKTDSTNSGSKKYKNIFKGVNVTYSFGRTYGMLLYKK